MVIDTRERLQSTVFTMEKVITDGRGLNVPRSGGMALSIAIVGPSILCDGPPVADLTLDSVYLSAADVINRTRLDLVSYYFANGNMLAAKNLLALITSPSTDGRLTSIDLKVLGGYCIALGVQSPFPMQGPSSHEMIPDQKVAFRSENIARNVVDGLPITSREKLTEKVVTERFVKSLLRQFPNVQNEEIRLRIDALLLFLCATVPGIKEELVRNGVDEPRLRPMATATIKATTPPPGTPILKALLKPENPFWTVITSFNAQEIKSALSTLEHFVLPYGNKVEWDASANSYATEIGQLAVANKKRILLEAIKVQTCIMNSRILVAHESMDAQVFDLHMRTVKGVFNDASVVNTSNSSQLITQVLAFALNAGEWDFVLGKIEWGFIYHEY
uniref:RNase III domain-containing protein n=1 Tax=Heterorhabditis bacteriophora TaxID=37862 RepID=A0A1I7XHK5_HETBA